MYYYEYTIEDDIEYLYDIGYDWYEIADILYLNDWFVIRVINNYLDYLDYLYYGY